MSTATTIYTNHHCLLPVLLLLLLLLPIIQIQTPNACIATWYTTTHRQLRRAVTCPSARPRLPSQRTAGGYQRTLYLSYQNL